MEIPAPRLEREVLAQLRELCTSAGYIHGIAELCRRDNFIAHSGTIETHQMLAQFSRDKLIRSEVSTLMGLMLSADIDASLPPPDVLHEYIALSDTLLRELHDAINKPLWAEMERYNSEESRDDDPLSRGRFLREPIFYASESAYNFQFREMAGLRYKDDEQWLREHVGFTILQAAELFRSLGTLQNEQIALNAGLAESLPVGSWSSLFGFTFTSEDLAATSGFSCQLVETILDAFTAPYGERNQGFKELNDYNVASSHPVLRPEGAGFYILLQPYSLAESLYDSPFYWMLKDKAYAQTAFKHRGAFTEIFCVNRLQSVFGQESVHPNVTLRLDKHSIAGEIDVLVTFAGRCIVLQAKSKRLTIPARKGNDGSIRMDFQQSVQDSYEQAFDCAMLLLDPRCTVLDANGSQINIGPISRIYPLCVVSDHYPALSVQVSQFLKTRQHQIISEPFVLDVFAIDVLTEFLTSPLHCLSYIDRRIRYRDVFEASGELVVLAHHLKSNLWSDGTYQQIMLNDDISVDLDMAMYARRDGAPARPTPEGILTRFLDTPFDSIIRSIESKNSAVSFDLGYMLLSSSSATVSQLNAGIKEIGRLVMRDGLTHDFSIGSGPSGLTVHCSPELDSVAMEVLQSHVARRKYIAKSEVWFGLCLTPAGQVRFVLSQKHPWAYDENLEQVTGGRRPGYTNVEFKNGVMARKKIGRNDYCPCGSGKKYKRCCID